MAKARKLTKREFVLKKRARRRVQARKAFPQAKKHQKTDWRVINLPVIQELEKLVQE